MIDVGRIEQFLNESLIEATGLPAAEALRAFHLQEHEAILAGNRQSGVGPSYEHVVDGHRGRALEQAKGFIATVYDWRTLAAARAVQILREMSPVDSGKYRAGHTIYLDNAPVGVRPPAVIRPEQSVLVSNPVPYARRIEVGKRSDGSAFVLQVPPKIYWRAVTRLRREFAGVLEVHQTFVEIHGGYRIKGKLTGRYLVRQTRKKRSALGAAGTQMSRKRYPKAGEAMRYPALYFRQL